MKRLIAIILATAMICGAWTGLAEEDSLQQLKTYSGNVLKELEKVYKENPEACGDEFILLAHSYYEMYQAVYEAQTAKGQFELASNPLTGGKSPMIEQVKERYKNGILIDKMMLDSWEQWLNGETESDEYLKFLMDMIGAVTMAIDETSK